MVTKLSSPFSGLETKFLRHSYFVNELKLQVSVVEMLKVNMLYFIDSGTS